MMPPAGSTNPRPREEGLFTGTSGGLNVVGALQLAQELGPGHTVVTVSADTGLKYLAALILRSIAALY